MQTFPDLELPYGLGPDGRMVAVTEVERGLACNCRCPHCDLRLVAKQGEIVRWHFAHEADVGCLGAYETMTHLLAKQIIADAGRIKLPALVAFHHGQPYRVIEPATEISLRDLRLEVWQQGFRPDIVATRVDDGTDLAIEVFVSHACDAEKIARIRQREMPAIEIDLSGYRRGLPDEPLFAESVISQADRIWLFHPRQESANALIAREIAAPAELKAIKAAQDHLAHLVSRLRYAGLRWQRNRLNSVSLRMHMMRFARARRTLIDLGRRLERAKGAADRLAEDLLFADGAAAKHRDTLRTEVMRRLRSAELADLWMRSTHPKLAFRRPVDVCQREEDIQRCLALLPRRR